MWGRIGEQGQIISGPAYPHGWKRANARRIARHVVRAFEQLGVRVSVRTVLAAYYDRTPLPYDPRRVDMPANVRHAADMLNFSGSVHRNALVDTIYIWMVAETRAGRRAPLNAPALALAYLESRAEMCARK
jgi:hypothetical protein